ncbi:MAG TPA: hypothetical protein VH593_34600 [Ktedonobacteraceae bacterium]|jgi:hypothetical protein
MLDDPFLEAVEARLSAVSGVRWEVVELDGDRLGVEVIFADGHHTVMQVTRESAPASNVDVLFIGRARSDIRRLLLAIQGKMVLSPLELAEIEARCRAASPAPWTAFIEGETHWSGDDFIQVSDHNNEPDLYLSPPPQANDLRFIAAARQDILDLITAVTSRTNHE